MMGPFYPDKKPIEHDNDLTSVKGHGGKAMGNISHLIGRVVNPLGQPISNAQIEIWQCDAFGQYKHSGDRVGRDPAFQGYGQTRSGIDGKYYFKTIKPVMYPGRAPHIHMRIVYQTTTLNTQIYVEGERLNNIDFILNSIRDATARNSLIIPFISEPGYPSHELVARVNPVVLA